MRCPSIENSAYDLTLVTAYTSYGEAAFNDAVQQIKASSPPRYKQYVKAIRNLFEKEQDKDTLVSMFDTMYRIFTSPYIKRHIQKQINYKIWPTAKKNPVLYPERQVQLDALLSGLEEDDKGAYTSLADAAREMADGSIKPKTIAFSWLNITQTTFEESLEASFTELDPSCIRVASEVYAELFAHSESRGAVGGLKRMCDQVAVPLQRFRDTGKQSDFFDALDKCWLDNVMRFKLSGKNIREYMFKAHFENVKEWEG